jgi:hypothetical protein
MYKIIGADQVEYGPVTAGEISRWIAEGRANAASLAQSEGATQWLPLAVFPEFAASLSSHPATPETIGPTIALPPRTNPMAVTGLILSLLAFMLGWFWVLLGWFFFAAVIGLLALTFSCLGVAGVNRNRARETGKLLAVAGIILSSLALIACLGLELMVGLIKVMAAGLERLQ